MFGDGPEATSFLMELYKSTSGDPAAQISMYDVGAALGLEKAEAGKIAEDLIGNGLVEVKTLSGGIAITAEGMEVVQQGEGGMVTTDDLKLNSGRVLDNNGRQALETLLGEVKSAVAQNTAKYIAIEEIVIDVKTAETQLLSPKPKTAVLRELLRSLAAALTSGDNRTISDRLNKMADG